mgnify:CR=1 FL=1
MFDEKQHNLKMDKAIENFSKELSSLRTGRANSAMLDLVKVDVYGQQMPINQIGNITTPDARTINVEIWDQSNISIVEKALSEFTSKKMTAGEVEVTYNANNFIN